MLTLAHLSVGDLIISPSGVTYEVAALTESSAVLTTPYPTQYQYGELLHVDRFALAQFERATEPPDSAAQMHLPDEALSRREVFRLRLYDPGA